MPVVHPAELWQQTGRWYAVGTEMGRFQDKNERDMVLAMTHEEVVADLVSREIKSYKQLPQLVYHIQTKWRDDPRPRSGPYPGARVHHEGFLQPRRRLGGPRKAIPRPLPAVFQHLPSLRPRRPRGALRHWDDGRRASPRIHVPDADWRRHPAVVRRLQSTRPTAKSPPSPNRPIPEEEPAAPEKIATPNTTTIEELTALLDIPAT